MEIGDAVRAMGEGVFGQQTTLTDPVVCEGSKFHSPTPMLVEPVYLSSYMQQIVDNHLDTGRDGVGRIWLCGTCLGNLKVYCLMLRYYEGVLPSGLPRAFGNTIRALGQRAWRSYLEQRVMSHG